MSRTALYKGYYFLLLGVFGAIAIAVLAYCHFSPPAVIALFIAYLIPGRILGFFWRDLLSGLRLLNAGQYAESKKFSERFLAKFKEKPWIRHLVWLGSSSYSRNPEVLALNNLGAAEIQLGQFDLARQHLDRAITLDCECPLPYFNHGVMLRILGEPEKAKQWIAEAAHRGFRKGLSDRIVMTSQTRFAETDGRG